MQLPERLIRAYVSPTLFHFAAVGWATVVNIGLGLGGATLQPGGVAGGLSDNGLDAASIQRKLHTHAEYQLQALQVSCICSGF